MTIVRSPQFRMIRGRILGSKQGHGRSCTSLRQYPAPGGQGSCRAGGDRLGRTSPSRLTSGLPGTTSSFTRNRYHANQFGNHSTPLSPGVSSRRRRHHGLAVAGIGPGLGRRQAEEPLLGAAGAVRLPVLRQRLPQQGVVGQGRRRQDGARQGARAAPCRSAKSCCSSAASTTRKP